MAAEYSKKTNAELVEILKSRSLPHTGKKADMVARLQEADKAGAGAGDQPTTTTAAGTGGASNTKLDVGDDVIDWDDDVSPDLNTNAETMGNTGPGKTDARSGGKGAVANPTAVPNQQVDIDPATTQDLNVAKSGEGGKDGKSAITQSTNQNGAAVEQGANESAGGAGETETEPAPAVNYSMGLASTDVDAEVAKRKARAEKFGIVDDIVDDTSTGETQKAAERAKRFGTGAQEEAGGAVKGLDEALSSERPRKRGRDNAGDSFRGGKRRDYYGRGRGRSGGGRRQPRNNGPVEQKATLSASDQAAMERRRQRFT